MPTDPKRTFRSRITLGSVMDERLKSKPRTTDYLPTGQFGLRTALGSGEAGSGGGGGGTSTPSPLGPLHSPWYQETLSIANNSNTDMVFGLDTVVASVTIFYYWERGSSIGVGKYRITHDGSTATGLPESEYGDPTGAAGITLTSSINGSNQVVFNVANDNSGSTSTFRLSYMMEGVTAGAAWGEYACVRGSRRGKGTFAVVHDGSTAHSYQSVSGDDCGCVISGQISAGTLDVVVTADSSDGTATTLNFTALVSGNGGTAAWQRFALTPAAGNSDSQAFTSDAEGSVDWGNHVIEIANNDSESFSMDFSFGAVWCLYWLTRGNIAEVGELVLWDDAGTATMQDTRWVDNSSGVSFTTSLSGASLVLTATTTNATNPCTLHVAFLGEARI